MSNPDGRRTQAACTRARGLGVKGRRVADTTTRVKTLNQKTLLSKICLWGRTLAARQKELLDNWRHGLQRADDVVMISDFRLLLVGGVPFCLPPLSSYPPKHSRHTRLPPSPPPQTPGRSAQRGLGGIAWHLSRSRQKVSCLPISLPTTSYAHHTLSHAVLSHLLEPLACGARGGQLSVLLPDLPLHFGHHQENQQDHEAEAERGG